jgi:hypothetical protein
VGPRLSGSSTAGGLGFAGQWKTQTRTLAVAGSAGRQLRHQTQADGDANEEKVQSVPIKGNISGRNKAGKITVRRTKLSEARQEALEASRHTQTVEKALRGHSWPPSEEETALLAFATPPLNAKYQSQIAASSSPTPLVPVEDGDLSAFAEGLSEAVDVKPEEDVEPKDDWDLANFEWSQLPRSPLMDAGFIAARDKHRQPKSDPSKERTEFQSLLEKNPYAIALASPVRRCPVTKTVLPKFFLQNFGILGHPKTSEPYLIPRGIFNANDTKQPDAFRMGAGMVGPGMYTLARYRLLEAMNAADRGFGKDPYLRVFPARMKEKRAMDLIRRTRFREDMQDFILEQARRRIVSFLKYLWGSKVAYMSPYDNWDDARTWAKQVGAFFWTGSNPDAANEPPEFATVESSERPHTNKHRPNEKTGQLKKGKIPVYNLKVLLGEEKMNELRSECSKGTLKALKGKKPSLFDAPIITLKRRRPTTSLELQLWWLQGYLAEHKSFLTDIEMQESALMEQREADTEAWKDKGNSYHFTPKNKE